MAGTIEEDILEGIHTDITGYETYTQDHTKHISEGIEKGLIRTKKMY